MLQSTGFEVDSPLMQLSAISQQQSEGTRGAKRQRREEGCAPASLRCTPPPCSDSKILNFKVAILYFNFVPFLNALRYARITSSHKHPLFQHHSHTERRRVLPHNSQLGCNTAS